MLAFIVTSKFADYLPLYRLGDIFSRQGFEIPIEDVSGPIFDASEGGAPSNQRSGYESLFCLGDAIKSNAFSLALDSIGLIPEAEGFTKVYENMAGYQIARKAGNALGYRRIVATQQGAKAVKQTKGAFAMGAYALGLQDTSAKGRISSLATVAGFIPGVGTYAAGVSIGVDLSDIKDEQSACVDCGKYD